MQSEEQATRFTRVLDFDAPKRTGDPVYHLTYGPQPSQAGAHDVCVSGDCQLPCPCTVSGGPMSFDIDPGGRLWLLDVVKERVAVFETDGSLAEEYFPDGNDFRDLDLQLRGDEAIVARQGEDFEAQVFSIRNGEVGPVVTVLAGGETVSNAGFIQVGPEGIGQLPPTVTRPGSQGGIYTELYERPADSLECCFGPAEILLAEDGSSAEAVHAPGLVPFLDGWFSTSVRRSRIFRLEAESSTQTWIDEIAFRFVRVINGERTRVPGVAVFEFEVAPDGTIHMLITAATDRLRGRNVDGHWYLEVAPDGTPGPVVPLRAPDPPQRKPNPTNQMRHLTLDDDGSPLLMWVGPVATKVRRPPG